jgi:hypothetical protein
MVDRYKPRGGVVLTAPLPQVCIAVAEGVHGGQYPARYLDDRGARLPEDRYRKLLQMIFRDIHTHIPDPRKIRRMSVYLLHAVQAHMKHQGDRYYEIAKTPRAAGSVAKQAMAGLEVGHPVTTELAKANAVLSARVQRRCKPTAETQPELFKAKRGG